MRDLGIYIHVPFCGKKCGYCDFYSVKWTKQAAEDYTVAVLRNLRHYSEADRKVDTVYLGGGTPSLLTSMQIESILSEIRRSFLLDQQAEITMEANPCTISAEKLSELRNAGVNRLSIGVQSMIDSELKMLGRVHSAERAVQAVLDAERAGFENISCDLMIALPEQKPESLQYSVEKLTKLPIKHISAYILKTEEGTPFDCDEIKRKLPDEDGTAELYFEMVQLLEKHGFMQYEVSNFAKEGYTSRHNCRYWKCEDYLGIGPAAHSCYNGKRFAVDRDITGFIRSGIQQITVTDENPCGFEEYAMLRLRLKEGLYLDDFPEHRNDIEKKLSPLVNAGYVQTDGESVWLTPKGFLMSNSVISYLVFD